MLGLVRRPGADALADIFAARDFFHV
jgi:hypothetical protein